METRVQSLGREDPVEKGKLPTPVFFSGESHGERSLVGYSVRNHKGSDTTEWLSLSTCTYVSRLHIRPTKSKSPGYGASYQYILKPPQFSRSVVSNSLWPHGLQYTTLPCPSPTSGAGSKSCPSSQWCHPTISSSVILFSSCLQSSQHQGLSRWVNSSHQVAKVSEFQLQH